MVTEKFTGRPVITESIIKPVAWFKFDEAFGDTTFEGLTNSAIVVKRSKTYWRQGISGTSLQFDDVSTFLSLPATAAPKPQTAITLEGWASIGAYPWNWCPIVQQADDVSEELITEAKPGMIAVLKSNGVNYKKEDDKGYFLGIDGHGHPGMKIRVGGNWEELTSDIHLERRNWYHIAGTYDKNSGKIALFVNGKPAGEMKVANPGDIELSNKNLQIGRGKERRQTDPVRANTFPDYYSFDGLLDEIKIYDVALTPEQVQKSFANYNTTPTMLASSDIPSRVLPTGDKTNKFGAKYSALKYFDTWDNLFRFSKGADAVVSLGDNPSKFVFWRGVSYIPMIVNEKNEWYSNEFNETWDKSGGHGCQEPMSDKSSDYSHVRVIENTPARVVVQWRFSLLDVNHVLANYNDTTGWSDWSDWYYYIYPDGVAAKKMHLWTDGQRNHEFQESMLIMGPDQHPHDLVEHTKTITMIAEDGKYKDYDWQNSPPENIKEPENSNIQLINYKAAYDPFTIATQFTKTNVYGGELTPYSVFCTWNHWPIAQINSSGRNASFPDRAGHSSISGRQWPLYTEFTGGKAPYYEKILMEGMTNQSAASLGALARSWLKAPSLGDIRGGTSQGYSQAQRAYIMTLKDTKMSFEIDASTTNPIRNLCFVINNWGSRSSLAEIKVNNVSQTNGPNFRQGVNIDNEGTYTLIVWLGMLADTPQKFEILKK